MVIPNNIDGMTRIVSHLSTTRNRVIHDRFPVTYLETVTNIVLSVTFIVFPSWFGRTGYPAHLVMTVVHKQSLINVTD